MHKGPSIKDISPHGEGGGYKKMTKKETSLVGLGRRLLWMVPNQNSIALLLNLSNKSELTPGP